MINTTDTLRMPIAFHARSRRNGSNVLMNFQAEIKWERTRQICNV